MTIVAVASKNEKHLRVRMVLEYTERVFGSSLFSENTNTVPHVFGYGFVVPHANNIDVIII